MIFASLVFGATTLTTLGTLFGNSIFLIERKWWNDYHKSKRVGKTSFKDRIKVIFIALLINFIFYLLFYIFALTKFYIGFIPILPIFLFINMQGGFSTFDGY